jgi:hypothetical protein
MISAIVAIIKLAPELIAIVSKAMEWAEQGIEWIEIRQRLREFGVAADIAHKTKDTSKLEDLFHSNPTHKS